MIKKLYFELTFLVILGVITSLSLPPFNYVIINFFTFSCIFIFLTKKLDQQKNLKIFFVYGWMFGFGYFITNLYWISISLTFDQNYKFLIPITIILIPSFLAIFYGLIFYFFSIIKTKKIFSSFLIFCLLFGVFEFIRGSILTGFPWNLIVYSFSNQLEFLSIASIIGTYGFNLFCISLFTSPAIFILSKTKKDVGIFFFFLVTTICFYLYGFSYKEKFYNLNKETFDYKIRVIGSNISIDRFYSNINPVSVIEELIDISKPNNKEKTIFIWPEGIFPGIFQDQLKEYNWLFNKNFNDNHFFIIGINSQSSGNQYKNYHNTFSIYDDKLNLLNSYNKINLVPFGEFLPLEKFLKFIGLKSITNNYQPFSKGQKREILEIKKENFLLKILPLICYEIIYSGELFADPNFDLIVNISEDGWFGHSIGPRQHFVHSFLRAIESGKYVLRSSNNGIAAVINPLGDIEKKVEFGKSGYIDFQEIRKMKPTIFSLYGNKIFIILIFFYVFLIFLLKKFKY